ncbi:aurora kinase C-like [Oppia nitens]|uniref:aurora kinase C-like n=1 Tax=Oppia nitens TaxID=1686743 RepID=UPI0023DA5E13|nr:aurora kinase C-like [Oppia nitens]
MAEHTVTPAYLGLLHAQRTGKFKADYFPEGLAPFGTGSGYVHDELYDEYNRKRTDSTIRELPIQGPPNWSQLWPSYRDIGVDYKKATPKGQPLPNDGMRYLRNMRDGVWKNFKFRELLGEGGYGSVWKVKADRKVMVGQGMSRWQSMTLACKVLRLQSKGTKTLMRRMDRLLGDMYALRYLQHKNIVNFVDIIGIPDRLTDFPYAYTLVLMEACDNDLFGVLEKLPDERLPQSECVNCFRQMADAVRYLHRQSVAHLDIKPENILCKFRNYSDTMVYKLTDFGLSVTYGHDQPMEGPLTVGTPDYKPPEMGTGIVQAKPCDIYSFGVTMVHALLGHNDFEPKTLKEDLMAISNRRGCRLSKPPVISRRLIKLLLAMTDANPGNRPDIDQVIASGQLLMYMRSVR